MTETLPLIIECNELSEHLEDANIVVIDLCKKESWLQAHIPGAVHIEYPQIIHVEKPVMGLLPEPAGFAAVLASLGVNNDSHIIAYDDEGGGKASRLLWTLEAYGFTNYSLLNGGLIAWANEGWPLSKDIITPEQGNITFEGTLSAAVSKRDAVLSSLEEDTVQLLDARSGAEFCGEKKFAARGGHIPGAINYDWMDLMAATRNGRLQDKADLQAAFTDRGFKQENQIICYCHTHHRSALSFIALKSLGYNNISGYPGSWSDWGNASDTPVEA